MPGANCSIYNCNTSRSHKFKGTAIFKIPAGKDEFNVVWRQKLINVVTKDRVIDQSLKKQIEENRIYICEKQFQETQINEREYIEFFCLRSSRFINRPSLCAHL